MAMENTNIPEETITTPVQKPKINWVLLSLVAITHFIIGTGAGLLIAKYLYSPKPISAPIVYASPTPIADPTSNSNIKTFTSEKLGVSFMYQEKYADGSKFLLEKLTIKFILVHPMQNNGYKSFPKINPKP